MNGMIGLVRSLQTVWLTDEMVSELQQTRGFPLWKGNDCPEVDPKGCLGGAGGRWEIVPGNLEVTFMHSMLVPDTDRVLYWGYTRADQT